MKFAIKEPGKDIEIIDSNVIYRQECYKQFFKTALPGILKFNKNIWIIVDDDGLYKNSDVNFLYKNQQYGYPMQELLGNVLFVKTEEYPDKDIDYKVIDLNPEDLSKINELISDQTQTEIKRSLA